MRGEQKAQKNPDQAHACSNCKKQFEQFVEDFNAEAAEQQAAEESDAEAFAEKYIAAMRRKLGMDGGAHEH